MTEEINLSPDDEERDVKLAEHEVTNEPYIAVSILFALTVLAIMNLVFGANTTIIIVAVLSGFMAWLILTAVNPPLNHQFISGYAGFIGVFLNTNSFFLTNYYNVRFSKVYLILVTFIILGSLYGHIAYRLGKETRDISQLIYFVLLSSFIVRGIFLIKTGF